MASQSQSDMFEKFQAFMAMQEASEATEERDTVTKRVLANAPKPQTQAAPKSKVRETTSKATGITRKLTKVDVEGEGVRFEVSATTPGGSMLTRGARVFPYVGESKYPEKSLTLPVLAALADEGMLAQLEKAIDKVSRDAKIGAYVPKADAS